MYVSVFRKQIILSPPFFPVGWLIHAFHSYTDSRVFERKIVSLCNCPLLHLFCFYYRWPLFVNDTGSFSLQGTCISTAYNNRTATGVKITTRQHASGVLKLSRAYSVNRFTGPAGVFMFRQSTTVRAGLYTSKSDTSKHLSAATFIFCSLPCLSQGQ